MTTHKMHADEIDIDAALVLRLLAAQFPQWAQLPIVRVESAGTDNAMFRLGAELVVRLPRRPNATGQVEKEQRWLAQLAPSLPLEIPVPLAMGRPDAGYPCHWSVYPWLHGENAAIAIVNDLHQAANDLAAFIRALQRIDPTGAPTPGRHNFFRGVPLAARDAYVRASIAALGGTVDNDAATAAWETSLRAPLWNRPPVWIHGDLQAGNLLVRRGRLTGVIDFGGLAAGDPACELMVAWNFLSADSRRTFREALAVDDAMWIRGRGWALSMALIALPYYLDTNPVIVASSRHTIAEVLADQAA